MTPRIFVCSAAFRRFRSNQRRTRPPKGGTTNFAHGFPHGATVLEVMFAIGIVAVGLLGTLTIIPVAGNRLTQGSIADNSDRLGRNAYRQFDVRQMRRMGMWTRFSTTATPQQYVPFSPTLAEPAFCIDPLFVSTQVDNANTAGTAVPSQTEFFPYFGRNVNTEARMRRISLRSLYNGSTGMTLLQAYQVFMAQDDLVFGLPKDKTLAPEQKFDAANAKRQFDGKYTWMATVSPKDFYYYVPANQLNTSRIMDLWTLSIVVLYRRDMSMTMHYANPAREGPDPERLVYADFRDASGSLTPGAGIGGGNVTLKTIDRSPSRPHVAQDLEVRKGDWLMLSAKVYPVDPDTTDNSIPAPVSVFRWYRVVSADAVLGNVASGFAREVTLAGPDWTDVIQAQLTSAPPVPAVAQATLVNGVVAVYEKTIRLETSGMWTQR